MWCCLVYKQMFTFISKSVQTKQRFWTIFIFNSYIKQFLNFHSDQTHWKLTFFIKLLHNRYVIFYTGKKWSFHKQLSRANCGKINKGSVKTKSFWQEGLKFVECRTMKFDVSLFHTWGFGRKLIWQFHQNTLSVTF